MGDFYPPPYIFFWWEITSMREFDGFAVWWLQILETSSPIFGWSGSLQRKESYLILNSSVLMFLESLRSLGRQLNSLGPLAWKLCSLKVWTDWLPLSAEILHSLPRLPFVYWLIPQFGMKKVFLQLNVIIIHPHFWPTVEHTLRMWVEKVALLAIWFLKPLKVSLTSIRSSAPGVK